MAHINHGLTSIPTIITWLVIARITPGLYRVHMVTGADKTVVRDMLELSLIHI